MDLIRTRSTTGLLVLFCSVLLLAPPRACFVAHDAKPEMQRIQPRGTSFVHVLHPASTVLENLLARRSQHQAMNSRFPSLRLRVLKRRKLQYILRAEGSNEKGVEEKPRRKTSAPKRLPPAGSSVLLDCLLHCAVALPRLPESW